MASISWAGSWAVHPPHPNQTSPLISAHSLSQPLTASHNLSQHLPASPSLSQPLRDLFQPSSAVSANHGASKLAAAHKSWRSPAPCAAPHSLTDSLLPASAQKLSDGVGAECDGDQDEGCEGNGLAYGIARVQYEDLLERGLQKEGES
mmetsp:Transcript_729/g.1571  ORF Transcript_729/g.1571 Transcript_729/m.1571 type:complete len:148 (-) Transcript_729:153-596(-)